MSEFERFEHLQPNLKKMVEVIRDAHRILVTMHRRPDGDAAGSAIAMGHILKAAGKEVTVYNSDEIPGNFAFLRGASDVVGRVRDWEVYDLFLILDCGDPGLLGKDFPYERVAARCAFIDHHSIPYKDCIVNLHDSAASATGEIIYHLAGALGVTVDKDIAAALYTAIITDTGSFRYSCTSADTMRVSSHLLATGIDVWDICSNIYENNPVQKVRLLGHVLRTLWVSPDGKLSCMYANRRMLRMCRCSGAMTDGFINYARSIRGVEVCIFLTELDRDLYRVSFRSRGNIDVSKIAASFGGGGHKNAAACTQSGTIEGIRDRVEVIVRELLG